MDTTEQEFDHVHGWVSDILGKSPKEPVRVCDPARGLQTPHCDPEAQLGSHPRVRVLGLGNRCK